MPRQAQHWSHASTCTTELKQSSSMQHDMVVTCFCCMLRPEQRRRTVHVMFNAYFKLASTRQCLPAYAAHVTLWNECKWWYIIIGRWYVVVAMKIRKVPCIWASQRIKTTLQDNYNDIFSRCNLLTIRFLKTTSFIIKNESQIFKKRFGDFQEYQELVSVSQEEFQNYKNCKKRFSRSQEQLLIP